MELTVPIERRGLASQAADQARPQVDVATLVPTYSPLLFRVAFSILHSPQESEDVVQEAFLRVLQHRDTLATIRDLRVWLTRIVWNLALDRRRRIQPGQMDFHFAATLVARDLPADAALSQAQHIAAVLLEVERLPQPERHALLLSAHEELGTPELAEILGRTESAVRALLSRARTRLRYRLDKKGVSR